MKIGTLAVGGGILSPALGPNRIVFGAPVSSKYVDKEVDSCCQFCQVRCTTRVQVKKGRVINAIRTLTKVSAAKQGKTVSVELLEADER